MYFALPFILSFYQICWLKCVWVVGFTLILFAFVFLNSNSSYQWVCIDYKSYLYLITNWAYHKLELYYGINIQRLVGSFRTACIPKTQLIFYNMSEHGVILKELIHYIFHSLRYYLNFVLPKIHKENILKRKVYKSLATRNNQRLQYLSELEKKLFAEVKTSSKFSLVFKEISKRQTVSISTVIYSKFEFI